MIGLLGGSFDPIHHGHLIVAQTVIDLLGLEELRFVPAGQQPFKQGRHSAPAELRAEMVALAIRGEPRLVLERAEIDRPGPSYTIDTLRGLHHREPGREFALLLGSDAAAELGAWQEAEAIPALARIVVFARPGSRLVAGPPMDRVIQVPAIDISATEVRARVRQGRSIRYLVPDAVAEFIARHRLYLSR